VDISNKTTFVLKHEDGGWYSVSYNAR
jgi:hypothetical protein